MLWGASWGVGIVLSRGFGFSQSLTGGSVPGRQEPGLQGCQEGSRTSRPHCQVPGPCRPGQQPGAGTHSRDRHGAFLLYYLWFRCKETRVPPHPGPGASGTPISSILVPESPLKSPI